MSFLTPPAGGDLKKGTILYVKLAKWHPRKLRHHRCPAAPDVMLSLMISHRTRKVLRVFTCTCAMLSDAVVVLKTAFGDLAVLYRFAKRTAGIGIVFTVAIFATA